MGNLPIFKASVKDSIEHCLDLLFPPRCAGCQQCGQLLCPACLANIKPIPAPFCLHCHTPLTVQTFCRKCVYAPLRLHELRTVSMYQDPLRSCIHAFKYNGKRRLAGPLGRLLARTYRLYGMTADLLIPVPLHTERQQERGYNQAQLLAEICTKELGVFYNSKALLRIRATQTQANLPASARQQNVSGAFDYHPALQIATLCGKNIVLIDDVCTTGATLEACAAPLYAANVGTVRGLVLARPG